MFITSSKILECEGSMDHATFMGNWILFDLVQAFFLLEELQLKNESVIFLLITEQYSLTHIVFYNYFDAFSLIFFLISSVSSLKFWSKDNMVGPLGYCFL